MGADASEIWVRCDGGPHGFLSIAAHGHADALSIEVRRGGVEILADPGTYCYHGEPEWRAYFKGTLGHNTLEVDGEDQARSGGPFMWLDQPESRVVETGAHSWQGCHDGYRRLPDPVMHHRRVELEGESVSVRDWIEARDAHAVTLAYHLGPEVDVALEHGVARLRWGSGAAALLLPAELTWRVHRAETTPPLGWHSSGFGRKTPSNTLVGRGVLAPGTSLSVRSLSRGTNAMPASNRRVLIVVENLPVPFDRRVWLEATTLARNGYRVSVICPKAKGFNKGREVLEDVEIFRYKIPLEADGALGFVFEFAWCFLATALISLYVALFGRGFDVLHACNPPDTFWLLGRFWKLFGRRYIFDHHDLCPEMFAVKFERSTGGVVPRPAVAGAAEYADGGRSDHDE